MDDNREFSRNLPTSGDGPSNNIKLSPRTRPLSPESDGDNNNNNNGNHEDAEAVEEVRRWNDHLNHVESKLFRFEQEIRDKESDLASTLNDCEALLGKLEEIQIPDTMLNCVTTDDIDDNLLEITNRGHVYGSQSELGLEEEENDFLQFDRTDSDFSQLITNLHLESEDGNSNVNVISASPSASGSASSNSSENARGLSLSTTERLQMELRALKRKPRVFVSTKFNDEENKYLALATSCSSSSSSHCPPSPSINTTDLNLHTNSTSEESLDPGEEDEERGGGLLCEFCGDFIPSTIDFVMHQISCKEIMRRVSEL